MGFKRFYGGRVQTSTKLQQNIPHLNALDGLDIIGIAEEFSGSLKYIFIGLASKRDAF